MSNVVVAVRPIDGILLAVDGVAPQAKIQQQRQRRYKGPRASDHDEGEKEDPELKELRHPIVDPNRITPGTDFMFRLDDFLTRWLEDPKNTLQLGVNKILYSSHMVPGEGEHKYLEFLRSGDIPNTGRHAVHGMDADLFILSLIAPVERIFITREDIQEVVSIQNLRYNLYRQMRNQTTPDDFALMTFFLGNDFFPHQPSLLEMKYGINALLTAYIEAGQPLTERRDGSHFIIWANLLVFLEIMAKNEGTLLANEAIKNFKYPSLAFEKSLETEERQEDYVTPQAQAQGLRLQKEKITRHTFYYETFREEWYQHALGPRGDTSILEFIMDRPVYQVTPERIDEQCLAYLRGLAWNLSYYTDGWNRASLEYVYPYHHTPLFSDLVKTLRDNLTSNRLEVGVFQDPDRPYLFNAIHQLLAVLPFESQNLLPIEVQTLMDFESPIYDTYPNQFIIDREATNYKWEGLAVIPFAESERIIAAVDNVPFPEQRWERYQDGNNFVVTFRQEDVDLARKQRDQMAKVQQLVPPRREASRGRGERGRGQERSSSTRGRGERGRGERGRGERGRGERGKSRDIQTPIKPKTTPSSEQEQAWRSIRLL